jgi:hypothetical protein
VMSLKMIPFLGKSGMSRMARLKSGYFSSIAWRYHK